MAPTITILGGGIAGLTAAIALRKAGIQPIILESAPAVKALGAGLALSANAIKAFEKLGMAEEVIKAGKLLAYFSIYDQQGKIITQTNSKAVSEKYGTDNFAIHRAGLHRLLLSKLSGISILTHKQAVAIEQTAESVTIRFRDGSVLQTDYLIAADGIHSIVRQQLQPDSRPRYAGYTCWRAVIDDAGIKLQEASETWGASGRFGIVPLADNKIYWFACINAPQNDQMMRRFKVADLQQNFRNYHGPIPLILEKSKEEELLWNDIIDVKPVERYAFGKVVLVGDAAHATTPNMGQGACQAIEDAVVLADELSKHADITKAFKEFEQRRLKRTHYIVNTSWNIGKVAQINNKVLAGCRNFLFRHLPSRVQDRQLEKLYTVDF